MQKEVDAPRRLNACTLSGPYVLRHCNPRQALEMPNI